MTAFARAARPKDWAVEIRTLNHRYFEFSLRVPPAAAALEPRIRELVQARIKRGKVTVGIAKESPANGTVTKGFALDESAVRFYTHAIRKLQKKFKLQGDVSVSDVLRLPGVFAAEQPEDTPEKIWSGLQKMVNQALLQAVRVKKEEGRKLARDIRKRLAAVGKAVLKIEHASRGRSRKIYDRLSERVNALLERNKDSDPDRVHREVAFLAERSDVTEEIVRLKSHLDVFSKRLETNGEVGRELDFLCQELNREINTLGSKAQLFEISTEVIFVKGEIEKIREQIQNIE